MESGSRRPRPRTLLVLLILTWATSWPVIKVGVGIVPALWFGCLRYAIAASCLFALLALRRELAFPPRSDWPLIAVSGALQMGVYSALTGMALTILPPGRASVLAFSTPLWVVPLASVWLGEEMRIRELFAVPLDFPASSQSLRRPFTAGRKDNSRHMECSSPPRRLGQSRLCSSGDIASPQRRSPWRRGRHWWR